MFLLQWNELGQGQSARLRLGKRELLRNCGFDLLHLAPAGLLITKLVHKDPYLWAPPCGQTQHKHVLIHGKYTVNSVLININSI